MRKALFMAAVTAALLAGVAYAGNGVGTATSSAALAAGALNLQGALQLISDPITCPPEAPPGVAECRAPTGKGFLRGLGRATEIYTWYYRLGPPTCPADLGIPLATTGRLIVEGEGGIRFALADGVACREQDPIRLEPQSFTITGGTGPYDGASGSGTLERNGGAHGTETWTGTLVAPGLEFDLTPPTLTGARSKTVRVSRRAKSTRVTYKVTASDAVDGQVRARCSPRSAPRFPVGRTVVRCAAMDSSANAAKARFVITVKRRR